MLENKLERSKTKESRSMWETALVCMKRCQPSLPGFPLHAVLLAAPMPGVSVPAAIQDLVCFLSYRKCFLKSYVSLKNWRENLAIKLWLGKQDISWGEKQN